MTKRKIKQTPPVNLSKQGLEWQSQINWDLLEQMDLEDEPQFLPMRDNPSPQSQTGSQEDFRKNLMRVDHFPQFKRQVPKK